MSYRHVIALVMLLVGQAATAVTPATLGAATARPNFRLRFQPPVVTTGGGQSSILSMYQDHRGFIWTGTLNGLSRYDGRTTLYFAFVPDGDRAFVTSEISCIAEDDAGNLWLGTNSGLHQYLRDSAEIITISDEFEGWKTYQTAKINDLTIGDDGNIWLATAQQGLLQLDRQNGHITVYRHDPADPSSLASDQVNRLLLDYDGILWVGTNAGLTQLDRTTGGCRNFAFVPGDSLSIPAGAVLALGRGANRRIWIGSTTGFSSTGPRAVSFTRQPLISTDHAPMLPISVSAVLENPDGSLWVGSRYHGLFFLDAIQPGQSQRQCRQFTEDPRDPTSLSDNNITSILRDHSDVVWIGTHNGANRLDSYSKNFVHVCNEPGSPASLTNNSVWAFQEDRAGKVWIATKDGLNVYQPQTGIVDQIQTNLQDDHSPSDNSFIALFEDGAGGIWMGSPDGALNRYDPLTKRYRRFPPQPGTANALQDDHIFAIESDDHGHIWFGSQEGVEIYDLAQDSFRSLRYDPKDPRGLPEGSVRSLLCDQEGRMWLNPSGNGVAYFDPQTRYFQHFTHQPGQPGSLSSDRVYSLSQGDEGNIWIGTGAGLDQLAFGAELFQHFGANEGLPSNSVYGVIADHLGSLWISSASGLSRFTPHTGNMQNFTEDDGIQGNRFNPSAFHRGASGRMYFGGTNGFTAFFPASIRQNPVAPAIVITDLLIGNESVPIGPDKEGRVILDRTISEAQNLDLPYGKKSVSFEFSALHYAAPLKNRFAYRLEGFEDEWNLTGTRNRATYTNLKPGHYRFTVKGTNNDGLWNTTGTGIDIWIRPPFYRRAWFLGLIITVFTAAIYSAHSYRLRLIASKNRSLEDQVAWRTQDLTKANSQLVQEIDARQSIEDELRQAKASAEAATRAKSDFLANMSHEIRTPMNGVLGMTALLRDTEMTTAQGEYCEAIFSSANGLLDIINDILDFSKIEAGKMKIENIPFDLCQILDDVTGMLTFATRKKRLRFDCSASPGVPRHLCGDPVRVRQILANLANNAVKFTSEGSVTISVSTVPADDEGTTLRFEVRDTGIGIPAANLEAIFQSFTQVDASVTRQFGGTGLGLAISQQLVTIMNGKIGVESPAGQGATFWFTIGFPVPVPEPKSNAPVLVIDHNPHNRELVQRQVELLGYPSIGLNPDRFGDPDKLSLPDHLTAVIVASEDCGQWQQTAQLVADIKQDLADRSRNTIVVCTQGCLRCTNKTSASGISALLSHPIAHLRLENAIANSGTETGATVPEVERQENAEDAPLILLAEDNLINQRVASLVLKKMGYRVEIAENGVAVLAAVARTRFDAILMDVQMPEMDGLEATRRIRAVDSPALDPQVPIIAQTAHAMVEDRQRSLNAGMDDHVTKPLNAEILRQALARFVVAPEAVAPLKTWEPVS